MSHETAPSTAVAIPNSNAVAINKTIDEVSALLRVDENTSDGRTDHEKPEQGGGVPWIGYRSPKSKSKLKEMDDAGIVENAFYLYDKGMIAPKPFYIHLLGAFHFFSQTDDDNDILDVSPILTAALRNATPRYSDHLIGLALVRMPGTQPLFKAATFSQKSAMTRSFDDIRDYVKNLQKDKEGREWKARGDKHREAHAAAKWPQFAVRAKIWGKVAPPSTPTGREYNLGLQSTEPTPVEDVKALNRYMGLEPESFAGECKKVTDYAAALANFMKAKAKIVAMLAAKESKAAKQPVVTQPPPAAPHAGAKK